MLKHQLIQIIKSFDRREMSRFREFVQSPYHNKHKDVQALVTYLSDCFPVFNDENCNRKILENLLFSKKKSSNQLSPVFTYTLRLLEQFLIIEQLREEEGAASMYLLRRLRERKLDRYYQKKLHKREIDLQQHPYRDGQFYLQSYRFASESDFYYIELSQQASDDFLQAKQDYLEYFFLCEKLKDACEMKLRSRILQVNYKAGLLPDLLPKIEKNLEAYSKVPPILLYYQLFQVLNSGEQKHYFAVLPLLKDYQQLFPKSERQIIYNYLLNFCIAQINAGHPEFLRHSFELYREQLDQQLLEDGEGNLYEWHFKNIVTVGIRLQEMDWTKQFIEASKNKLRPTIAENAYAYSLAAYYYAIQEYEAVLPLLMKVEFTNIRYNLDAKALLLRTYYDLDEYEAFLSLFDAFRQYVKRNKQVTDIQQRGYSNLFRLAKRAFVLKNRKEFSKKEEHASAVGQLQKQLDNTSPVYNLGWLKEKVAEL